MATYHLTLKVGAKGKASAHFNYICAIEKYESKRGVVHVESGNMPVWAMAAPALFWQASDEFERTNGTVYRELEVSLPRELSQKQHIELARELAYEACGDKHAFSFAIHNTKASDGGMNPHAHLQFSERVDDGLKRDPKHYFKRANKKEPEKGGCIKDRSWQAVTKGRQKFGAESSERLLEMRQSWAIMCNKALEEFGSDARIDHRSNEARGIEAAPQPKVGAKSWHLFQRASEKNGRYCRWKQVIASNNAIITKVASKQCAQERYHDAVQELQTAQHQLVALYPVRRPNKPAILRGIAENQKHVRQLDNEIWQLEHISRHKAYDHMKQAEWKRDAGSNMFMRAWSRFYYGGDFNRLKEEYEDVLQLKYDKLQKREKIIERLYNHPDMKQKVSTEYHAQMDAYRTYHHRKGELENTIQLAENKIDMYSPQLSSNRLNSPDHSLQLRM